MSSQVRNPSLLLLRNAAFDPADRVPEDVGFGLSRWRDQRGGRVLGILQLKTSPTEKARRLLRSAGAEILYYIPNNAYLLRFDLANIEALSSLPMTRAVFRLPKWAKLAPEAIRSGKQGIQRLEIMAAPGRGGESIAAVLGKSIDGIEILSSARQHQLGRVIVKVPRDRLFETVDLATGLEAVLWVDLFREKILFNDNSIWVGQSYDTTNTTNYAVTAPIWNHGILGAGQIVCVNDSGLDSDMCYFRLDGTAGSKTTSQVAIPPSIGTLEPNKKVIAYYVEPGADDYDTSSASYHGTHVTGSVLGDNYSSLSTGTSHGHDNGDGMAPQAKVVFQDVGNSSGGLAGLAGDLSEMFRQAYDAGARIHSDSWGTTESVYDGTAMDMDEFMFRNQDFLFVVAMGNSGTAPGDGSIGSPATAKDIVSVGATTNGGASSHADNLKYYSRGPVDDGRLKPDIVSPGSSINSASGSSSNTDDNCGSKTLSGTSMATPTTSGYLALLRQYFTDGFYPSGSKTAADAMIPSGALMKATLLVGGMPLGGTDEVNGSPVSPIPSMDQGWGRTHLDQSLYFSGDSRALRVWDVRHDAGISTGEEMEFTIDVPSNAEPLNIRLAWSDPESTTLAAVNLVNNLDLEVVSPSKALYLGNVFSGGVSTTGGSADVLNPIEGVTIPSPAPGSWTIRVKGTAVPGTGTALYSDRQGYAVAATFAACSSTPAAPTGLTATAAAPTGINLSWTYSGSADFLIFRAPGISPDPGEYSLVGASETTSFTDTHVQGGYSYSYRVRATDDCAESSASAAASTSYDGPCTLYPDFDGLLSVENDLSTALCDLRLEWNTGSSNCPNGPDLHYNIYRSNTPYFSPGASNLVVSVTGSSYVDNSVIPYETSYYLVRAEDSTSGNGGQNNGGNEEKNTRMLKATPWAASSSPGTFEDDGGDTNAKLILDGEWRVSNQENHSSGGAYSYHNAPDGGNYSPGQCSSAMTPPLQMQSGSPQLSYWVNYNMESGWDGVVVEVNDCDPDCSSGTWTVSTPSAGYPGSFSDTGSPPVNACAYPSTQDCFNGPSGNGGLSGWTQYSHDLTAWAGQEIQLRWHFSSDGGLELDGLYLDDIEITQASVNDDCANRNGRVQLGRSSYNCSDTVDVELADSDLNGAGSQLVLLASDSEPGGESLSLVETPPNSGSFAGTIQTTGSAANASDGMLSVIDGNTITVSYIDADDGSGGLNVTKTDTAAVDCQAPIISAVQALNLSGTSASVSWTTDEAADSRLSYGTSAPPGTTVSDASPVTSHHVDLSGLSQCTDYYYSVASADVAGNLGEDDHGGAYYLFTTPMLSSGDYDSSDTPMAIADSATTNSTLNIGADKIVEDVNVQLDITHTWDADLDIFLISPSGTRVELTTDNGSSGDNFSGTIFDDEATTPITDGSAPFAGAYQPETPLSAVDGENAQGNWVLEITDDAGSDVGALNWWKLSLSYPDEPCTLPDEVFTDGFESGGTSVWSWATN